MAAIDVLKAQLVRSSVNEDWGIRLQGGADIGAPLCIHRVTPGSPAHRIGLNNNDQITFIEDTPTKYLNHQDAFNKMQRMGESMVITVERISWGRPPTQPMARGTAKAQPKFYQTLNMTGAQTQPDPNFQQYEPSLANTPNNYNGHNTTSSHLPSYPSHLPAEDTKFYQTYDLNGPRGYPSQPQANVEFRIAKPKLFEEPVRPAHIPPAPPSVPVVPDLRSPPRTRDRTPQFSPPPPNVYRAGPVKYVPEEDKLADDTSQSRTFKILRSLMENEGFPLTTVPDTISEPREDALTLNRTNNNLVHSQYNSPWNIYSDNNVHDSLESAIHFFQIAHKNSQETNKATQDGRRDSFLTSETYKLIHEMETNEIEYPPGMDPSKLGLRRGSERTNQMPFSYRRYSQQMTSNLAPDEAIDIYVRRHKKTGAHIAEHENLKHEPKRTSFEAEYAPDIAKAPPPGRRDRRQSAYARLQRDFGFSWDSPANILPEHKQPRWAIDSRFDEDEEEQGPLSPATPTSIQTGSDNDGSEWSSISDSGYLSPHSHDRSRNSAEPFIQPQETNQETRVPEKPVKSKELSPAKKFLQLSLKPELDIKTIDPEEFDWEYKSNTLAMPGSCSSQFTTTLLNDIDNNRSESLDITDIDDDNPYNLPYRVHLRVITGAEADRLRGKTPMQQDVSDNSDEEEGSDDLRSVILGMMDKTAVTGSDYVEPPDSDSETRDGQEPYSGADGLPPPRSAEMERMKEDFAKQNPKGRVKVFMPQQYNSPMGMYSPENVMESFQTQAEGYFDDLDRKETQASEQTISNTAKAVLEQEGHASSDF